METENKISPWFWAWLITVLLLLKAGPPQPVVTVVPPSPPPVVVPVEKPVATIVAIRDTATTTVEQTAILLEAQTAEKEGAPPLLILNTDTKGADNEIDPRVQAYIAKIPPGGKLPYLFFVDAGGEIVAAGELESVAGRLKELRGGA